MHIRNMASNRINCINNNMFICVLISLLLPSTPESVTRLLNDRRNISNDDGGRRLTREYDLRQGALRGLIVKPNRHYDLQSVEMFLGIPYAAPPVGNFRFMPPGELSKAAHTTTWTIFANSVRSIIELDKLNLTYVIKYVQSDDDNEFERGEGSGEDEVQEEQYS